MIAPLGVGAAVFGGCTARRRSFVPGSGRCPGGLPTLGGDAEVDAFDLAGAFLKIAAAARCPEIVVVAEQVGAHGYRDEVVEVERLGVFGW
jgi:hypothetical protein